MIQVLAESPKICSDHQRPDSKLRQLSLKNSFHPDTDIAAQAVQILTKISCYWYAKL